MNSYIGENGLYNFLNPHSSYATPLVELPKKLNPFYDKGVRIYVKLLNLSPLLNVKSLPAWNMLAKENDEGKLSDIHTLVESSSGNTVYSLAVLGKQFGIDTTKAFASQETSLGKIKLLQFFGIDTTIFNDPICPNPTDKNSSINKAKAQGQEEGYLNPGQYSNQHNPEIHLTITGPQIYEQTEGKVTVFCAGLGTTGTFVGTSAFLKKNCKKVSNVGVVRKQNNPVPGVRTKGLLSEINFQRQDNIDTLETVGTKESYNESLLLSRYGLLLGPSGGMNLAGLKQFIQKNIDEGTIDNLRNSDDNMAHCVFIGCDTPFPYIDDYFKYLDHSSFGNVENEHLLSYPLHYAHTDATCETSPQKAWEQMYKVMPEEDIDEAIEAIQFLNENIVIYDIRNKDKFDAYHIPFAKSVDYKAILKKIHSDREEFIDKKIFLICEYGEGTFELSRILREHGLDAYSICGGMVEWSEKGLQRIKDSVCVRS